MEELSKHRTHLADFLDYPTLRGVKNSVIEKYSDQVHFIYELLQVDHIANVSKCETISCHTEPDVKYKCNSKDNAIEGKDEFKEHKKNGG